MKQTPHFDSKNFIAAMVLSTLIIFGWQYFFVAPQQEAAKKQQEVLKKEQQAAATAAPTIAKAVTREAALAGGGRIKIETPVLSGSINLKGAQLDDLSLKTYRVNVDPTSAPVVVLSPAGTPNAYFSQQLVVPATGTTFKVPTPETVWTASGNATLTPETPVVLSWDNGDGVTFRREISLSNDYLFAVKQTVENKSQTAIAFSPFSMVQRQDTPKVEGFYVFFEGLLGVHDGELQEVHYADVAEAGGKVEKASRGGWLGFTDKYWSATVIPDKDRFVSATYQYARDAGRDIYQTSYQYKDALTVQPGQKIEYTDRIFAGAKVVKTINTIGTEYGLDNYDLMIDWGWFPFLTKPMFWLLDYVKQLVGNFGLAILLVTVLVKLAVFPLANKSYASMSKMKKLQPEMERLKKEYPDDRAKMQQEVMELYKREKVSPVSGCLPVLVQIPVFFALYKVILTSIELRHAPFYGWIKDLSAQDPTHLFNLFGLIPWNPPAFLAIGIWPVLMGITMWIQMRLNPAPTDPIQASMFNWMPLIFTFMLGSFPAGLVIYWTWSNLLSIIQQSYIMKKNGTEVDLFGNIRGSIPFLKKNEPVAETSVAAPVEKKKSG
jgi:YidC/Oxa1 family membrane protein insertase